MQWLHIGGLDLEMYNTADVWNLKYKNMYQNQTASEAASVKSETLYSDVSSTKSIYCFSI